MNEGQNDNLSTKSVANTQASKDNKQCTSAVCVYERERDRQTETEKQKQTDKEGRERERWMSMYLHGSLVVRIDPVAGSC